MRNAADRKPMPDGQSTDHASVQEEMSAVPADDHEKSGLFAKVKIPFVYDKSFAANIFISIASCMLIALLWKGTFAQIAVEREEAISAAIKVNTNQAIAFEEYTSRTIKSVDAFTQYLKLEYKRTGIKTNIGQLIENLGIDKDFIANVAIADEHGKLVISAFIPKPTIPIDFSDLDHFKIHVAQDLGKAYIGKPVLSRIFGKLAIPITRRINKDDGSFGGVIMVQIEPTYFTKFYREAATLQPNGMSLIGLDGTVRAQRRGQSESSGEDISMHAIFKGLAAHSSGEISSFDQSDGNFRYISYRTLSEFPLVVMVSTAETDILSSFYRRKTGYNWTAALVSLLIAAIALILIVSRIKQTRFVSTLRESETRFRILVESLPQLVWICRPDGQAIYINQKLMDFSGLSLAESYGHGWQRILHRSDHKRMSEAWQQAIKTGEAFNVEYRLRRADGIFRWMLVRGIPMKNPQCGTNNWLGTCTDIEDQKRIEQRLQESEQRFKAISTNIPGMVFQLQKKNDSILFTYVSVGAAEVYGIDASTIMSHPETVIDLLDEESAASFYHSMDRSEKELCIWNWEGKLKPQADEYKKWVNLRATPRHVSIDCVIWDGVIFNITEAKKYEASLEEKRGLLQDLSAHQVAVKEKERKRIAREIHDELGQRLTVLRMDVLMLRKHPDAQSQDIKDVIHRMRDAIDDILRIIRNIASALRPAALDIGFVMAVEWLIDEFQKTLKIPCTFKNHVVDPILLDDERATGIFRILQESLTNVMRHAKAKNVTVTLEIKEHFLFLGIQDDGVGFTEEYVKNRKSFGLVGMRERAAMLNGEIFISSSPRAGTAVNVRIPI